MLCWLHVCGGPTCERAASRFASDVRFVRVVPCCMGEGELSAKQVATLFFNAVVRLFGLPDEVLHDRDPRFTADFWRHLWDSLGSRAVFSSAYHP